LGRKLQQYSIGKGDPVVQYWKGSSSSIVLERKLQQYSIGKEAPAV
jgi:hypothetical protein